MQQQTVDIVPERISTTDDPAKILRFAAEEATRGGVALCTLIDIQGGSARSLGAHVAVAADGRFCGYVSGGCVEAALASEAVKAIGEGRDRIVTYGDGSPFFDIVLPCGGGITIAIHLLRDAGVLLHVLKKLEKREVAGLEYDIEAGELRVARHVPPRVAHTEGTLTIVYRPRTRLAFSGQAGEAEALARLAESAGYDVVDLRAEATLNGVVDAFTAVVLLHHDIDAEERVLEAALRTKAFYIGALGSTRTHRRRVDRLREHGVAPELSDRIRAPIGIFGPTRDSVSLAISVLADISAARLEKHGG